MDRKVQKAVEILKRYEAKEIKIFGSYAKGTVKEGSDLDIIVGFANRKSLLDLVGIEQELEEV